MAQTLNKNACKKFSEILVSLGKSRLFTDVQQYKVKNLFFAACKNKVKNCHKSLAVVFSYENNEIKLSIQCDPNAEFISTNYSNVLVLSDIESSTPETIKVVWESLEKGLKTYLSKEYPQIPTYWVLGSQKTPTEIAIINPSACRILVRYLISQNKSNVLFDSIFNFARDVFKTYFPNIHSGDMLFRFELLHETHKVKFICEQGTTLEETHKNAIHTLCYIPNLGKLFTFEELWKRIHENLTHHIENLTGKNCVSYMTQQLQDLRDVGGEEYQRYLENKKISRRKNAEKISEYGKNWRANNTDRIREYNKTYQDKTRKTLKQSKVMNNENFAKNLICFRKKLNLTQESLAGYCGISHSTQAQYERGMMLPNTSYLLKIHELGVDINTLLFGINLDHVTCSSSVQNTEFQRTEKQDKDVQANEFLNILRSAYFDSQDNPLHWVHNNSPSVITAQQKLLNFGTSGLLIQKNPLQYINKELKKYGYTFEVKKLQVSNKVIHRYLCSKP